MPLGLLQETLVTQLQTAVSLAPRPLPAQPISHCHRRLRPPRSVSPTKRNLLRRHSPNSFGTTRKLPPTPAGPHSPTLTVQSPPANAVPSARLRLMARLASTPLPRKKQHGNGG